MEKSEKFEQIYLKYRVLMYRVAFGLLKNRQDTEDAVQDAFVRIYDHISDIDEVDSPRTRSYVMVITRNICLNELRSKKHESGEDIEQLNTASEVSVEDEVLSGLEVAAIERALRELPEKYRDILYLTVYGEYDLRNAALLLGISYENAKSRVQRARKKLAELLERRAVNYE